ncbi:hypothetical protein KG091_01970 [Carnobacteriaceae bacterium zg-ZUI78]|nr:hypothetical protein [Carnobacteriaceae bacterium zg-ZUI78]
MTEKPPVKTIIPQENQENVTEIEPKAFQITTTYRIDEEKKVPENTLCHSVSECSLYGDSQLEKTHWNVPIPRVEYALDGGGNEDLENGKSVARYDVVDDTLLPVVKTDLTAEEQKQSEEVFDIFKSMIPKEWRKYLAFFYVYKGSGFSAAVYNDQEHPLEQELFFDIDNYNDLKQYGAYYPKISIIETMVHEFGHMFSLSPDQRHLDFQGHKRTDFYLSGIKSDGYLRAFYQAFWKDIDPNWIDFASVRTKDDERFFYEKNKDNFVGTYATTDPDEDFAESFKYFIFTQRNDFKGLPYEQKILFFYQYPELVLLRAQMIKEIVARQQ